MRGRVAQVLTLVVPPGDHVAVDQYDGADGNVTVDGRAGRLLEGDPHRSRVVHVSTVTERRQPARCAQTA